MYKENLKYERTKEDIKAKEIADFLKINKSNYYKYENERIIIPLKHLISICDYFNASLDYIFNLNNNTNYINSKKGINLTLFSKRLIELRKELKLSQESFSRVLNNKRTNISGYELNKITIPTELLYQICKKYNISVDYLIGKIDTPKYLNSTKK